MATGYHCSTDAALQLRNNLCVADDKNVAAMYRRSGAESHSLYTLAWDDADIQIADEATLIATFEQLTGKPHDEAEVATWDVAKAVMVRKALLAQGFSAIVYGDSHEGCNYETTDFLALPQSLQIVSKEEVVNG